MVFSSPLFLFAYLPLVWLINRFLPQRWRNAFLCMASLLFYAWGEPVYVLLMIASVFINYLFSLRLDKGSGRRWKVGLAVVVNLAILAVFKYTDFFLSSINHILELSMPLPNIRLPIGISFFTFQAMSYTIDVYRGVTKPQTSLGKLLLYVSFFPQLIAGPIVKYHDVAAMIDARSIQPKETAEGIRRFILGLSKKLLIANTLGQMVDAVYGRMPASLSAPLAWAVAIGYTLQLYYDFSGYSDMAIGLGKMFGFSFKENFDHPLVSKSIRDFWRRWHMSLSTWFREYVYIPLGGNRKGAFRTGVNRIIVFFLTGLWHGAQWTFVVWGLLHGFFLLLEQYRMLPIEKINRKLPLLGHLYTVLVVVFSFVLFRAESFHQAFFIWKSMLMGGFRLGLEGKLFTPLLYGAFFMGIIGCYPWIQRHMSGKKRHLALEWGSYGGSMLLLLLCMLTLAASTHNPFIYFRF